MAGSIAAGEASNDRILGGKRGNNCAQPPGSGGQGACRPAPEAASSIFPLDVRVAQKLADGLEQSGFMQSIESGRHAGVAVFNTKGM
jgi:hypothetical protein